MESCGQRALSERGRGIRDLKRVSRKLGILPTWPPCLGSDGYKHADVLHSAHIIGLLRGSLHNVWDRWQAALQDPWGLALLQPFDK